MIPVSPLHPVTRCRFSTSVEQTVSLRLREARRRAGMNQTDLAERLAPLLGHRYSVAMISRFERVPAPPAQQRAFTATEVAAFARVFDLPICFFFEGPRP